MNSIFFKSLGVICFLLAAVTITEYVNIVLLREYPQEFSIGTTVRTTSVVLLMSAVGVGFLYSRKWAAILASIFFTYVGVRLFYDATSLTGGRAWIIVSASLLFFLPLLGTIKFWRFLRPGGRWYF